MGHSIITASGSEAEMHSCGFVVLTATTAGSRHPPDNLDHFAIGNQFMAVLLLVHRYLSSVVFWLGLSELCKYPGTLGYAVCTLVLIILHASRTELPTPISSHQSPTSLYGLIVARPHRHTIIIRCSRTARRSYGQQIPRASTPLSHVCEFLSTHFILFGDAAEIPIFSSRPEDASRLLLPVQNPAESRGRREVRSYDVRRPARSLLWRRQVRRSDAARRRQGQLRWSSPQTPESQANTLHSGR